MELVKAPTDQAFAAVCFAVVQTGKIRRCEDFRRSRHNETVAAEDSPAYTDVEQYIRLVQKLQQLRQGNPMIWLQDLEGAYRQVPVEQDRIAIPCSSRRRVPRSGAAPFGAAASVWAFCRFADGMVPVARRLLCVPHGHFVDDFTGAELEATAESACSTFRDMFQELGLCMKESKEQPPKTRQKVLGVIITVRDDAMMVEACPQRQQNSLGCWTKWNSTTR